MNTGSLITIGTAAFRSRILGRQKPTETVKIETMAGETALARVKSLEIGK